IAGQLVRYELSGADSRGLRLDAAAAGAVLRPAAPLRRRHPGRRRERLSMAGVRFESVGKEYSGTPVVREFTLEVPDREFLVLVGPSGCGKSTTLRMLAGLESVTSGGIYIGDRLVNDVPARDRDIAMVFQSYALYPHMTVRENLAF